MKPGPAKQYRTAIRVNVTWPFKNRLRLAARREGMTRNDWVRTALEEALARHEDEYGSTDESPTTNGQVA